MISFFSIQGIVDQLQIISNPNTIDIDWLRLRSDSASLPRSLKLQRQHCIAQQGKHDGDCRPLQKKEKSGRPSGSGPKNAQTIRLFWCNATNETQFSLIGSWLSNICNSDTMWLNCVNIGRSADPEPNKMVQQRAKSGRPTKLQQLRTAKAKSFAIQQIVEELQNWPVPSNI